MGTSGEITAIHREAVPEGSRLFRAAQPPARVATCDCTLKRLPESRFLSSLQDGNRRLLFEIISGLITLNSAWYTRAHDFTLNQKNRLARRRLSRRVGHDRLSIQDCADQQKASVSSEPMKAAVRLDSLLASMELPCMSPASLTRRSFVSTSRRMPPYSNCRLMTSETTTLTIPIGVTHDFTKSPVIRSQTICWIRRRANFDSKIETERSPPTDQSPGINPRFLF